jgi:hypothetical protein
LFCLINLSCKLNIFLKVATATVWDCMPFLNLSNFQLKRHLCEKYYTKNIKWYQLKYVEMLDFGAERGRVTVMRWRVVHFYWYIFCIVREVSSERYRPSRKPCSVCKIELGFSVKWANLLFKPKKNVDRDLPNITQAINSCNYLIIKVCKIEFGFGDDQ